MPEATSPRPGLFALSAVVFAERDGKILILKRAMGAVTGGWYVPGGAVDEGEDPETAARRELLEEAGLSVTGSLELVAITPMRAYGRDTLQVAYACPAPDAEVALSHEHSGARWVDPAEYRDRYFADAIVDAFAAQDAEGGTLVRAVRDSVDAYLAWRGGRTQAQRVLTLRLTAEVYVARGDDILVLKRRGGRGDGVWYLPGGIVEPGEDPREAALRETLEETGLRLDDAELIRVWSFPDPDGGHDVFHAAYFAPSETGDVVLSDEHSAFRWMTPAAYCERFWNDDTARAAPQWATWMREVRANCATVASRLRG